MADEPRDAFEAALASVAPDAQDVLRRLVDDTAYVVPRVVSHLDL